MAVIEVSFKFETEAPQSEGAARRSIRDALDDLVARYAGEVVEGSVLITVEGGV